MGNYFGKVFVPTAGISFVILMFTACKIENGKNTVKDFIIKFYTVNQIDYDYYLKMMNGAKTSELED